MGGPRLFRLRTQTRLGVSSRSNGIQQCLTIAYHAGNTFSRSAYDLCLRSVLSRQMNLPATRHLLLIEKPIPSSVSEPLSPICKMKTLEWVAHAIRSLASHNHGCSCQYNSPK